jgi:hypothetical protein
MMREDDLKRKPGRRGQEVDGPVVLSIHSAGPEIEEDRRSTTRVQLPGQHVEGSKCQ